MPRPDRREDSRDRGSKHYVFTWNNPPLSDEKLADSVREAAGILGGTVAVVSYLIYQMELSTSGTRHIQGYLEFTGRLRIPALKRAIGTMTGVDAGGIHFEPRLGSAAEAIAYCSKHCSRCYAAARQRGDLESARAPREGASCSEDRRISDTYEWGIAPHTEQGRRTDIEEFRDAVLAGAPVRELASTHLKQLAKYHRLRETLAGMSRPMRRETPLEVELRIGDPGTGKSRYYFDKYEKDPSFFVIPLINNTIWCDGYDGHEIVLLEEFAGAASKISLDEILRFLDIYPIFAPVKGSHVWYRPRLICITTNVHPKDWYKWEGRETKYHALCRRITRVYADNSDEPLCAVDREAFFDIEGAPVRHGGQGRPSMVQRLLRSSRISESTRREQGGQELPPYTFSTFE